MNLQCQNNSFTIFGYFDYLVNISELNRITNVFSEYSPSFVNEITPTGPSNAIRLENKNDGIVVMLRSNSVIITKAMIPSARPFNIGLVEDFCSLVKGFLLKLFEKDYMGNRVAIRTQCFVLDPKSLYTSRIVSPLCKGVPSDFHINMNNQTQLDDQNFKETLNVICNVDSAKATAPIVNGKTVVLNALSIRTDINTVAENNEYRFSKHNIEQVLNHLTKQDEKVFSELTELLDATQK